MKIKIRVNNLRIKKWNLADINLVLKSINRKGFHNRQIKLRVDKIEKTWNKLTKSNK